MRRIYGLAFAVLFALLLAAPAFCAIDVNTASQSELESLPGIGPTYAKRIMEGRPYRSVNDLTRVKGIGSKTLNKFRNMVTCGAPKKKKKTRALAQTVPAKDVPVYSTDKFRQIKCWRCKNISKVSSDLKQGWCPYCCEMWKTK